MNNLSWLLTGDETVNYLVRKNLLNEEILQDNQGHIKRLFSLYDDCTQTWGKGYYGPKWVSTHYTLLDLVDVEVRVKDTVYEASLMHYVKHIIMKSTPKNGDFHLDLCICGMLIKLMSYAKIEDDSLYFLLDYVLHHSMPDGGYNCMMYHESQPKISSLHTTINVCEGLAYYVKAGYLKKLPEVKHALERGLKTLLNRQLLYKSDNEEPVFASLMQAHFPCRWKYDYLRALYVFAFIAYPYTPLLHPALNHLLKSMKKGKLRKGSTYSGRIHFPYENTLYGRMNTYRAYYVLKHYDPSAFDHFLQMEY